MVDDDEMGVAPPAVFGSDDVLFGGAHDAMAAGAAEGKDGDEEGHEGKDVVLASSMASLGNGAVSRRRPFGRDTSLFAYDVDSEAEWEPEGEGTWISEVGERLEWLRAYDDDDEALNRAAALEVAGEGDRVSVVCREVAALADEPSRSLRALQSQSAPSRPILSPRRRTRRRAGRGGACRRARARLSLPRCSRLASSWGAAAARARRRRPPRARRRARRRRRLLHPEGSARSRGGRVRRARRPTICRARRTRA